MTKTLRITQSDLNQKREFHINALKELDILQRMLDAHGSESPALARPRPLAAALPRERAAKVTKQSILLRIIQQHPDGISTRDIIAEAHKCGLSDYNTKNVSPKLSHYQNTKGWLLLEKGRWKITDIGREQLKG